jgi:uncharacterized protein YoxC
MFDRKEIVQDAVEAVIERTDLNPGEVNQNMKKAMATISRTNDQFDRIRQETNNLMQSSKQLNSNATDMAEAGVTMAKAAQELGRAVNDLSETQERRLKEE